MRLRIIFSFVLNCQCCMLFFFSGVAFRYYISILKKAGVFMLNAVNNGVTVSRKMVAC